MAFLFLVRSVRVLGSKARLAQGHLVEDRLKQAHSQVGMRSRLKAFASPYPPSSGFFTGPSFPVVLHPTFYFICFKG